MEDTPINRKFNDIAKGVMHNKFLPSGVKISADILVFDSMIALISYDKLVGTLIEDKSIAESMKLCLEMVWEKL